MKDSPWGKKKRRSKMGREQYSTELVCLSQNLYFTNYSQVSPFLKFTKFSILSQFVKNQFLKYSIFTSKTTSLLKHITEETNFYRNEHYFCMTVVAMSQNVKT